MKALIIYESSTGTTESCAKAIANRLPGAELHELRKKGNPTPEGYDTVVVGGYIRGGGLSPLTQMYLEECEAMLAKKRLGLFICCGTDEKADEYFKNNVSEKLLDSAKVCACFGGELNPDNAKGFIDRIMIKTMVRSMEKDGDVMELFPERIPGFVDMLLADN